MIDTSQMIRRLEEVGEETVRQRLASNVYGPQEKSIVEMWLQSKERDKDAKRYEEQMRLARQARIAAWVSAIAAAISALAAAVAWLK